MAALRCRRKLAYRHHESSWRLPRVGAVAVSRLSFGNVQSPDAGIEGKSIALAHETVDIDHGLGKGLGSFLRQIVPDAARDQTVGIFA